MQPRKATGGAAQRVAASASMSTSRSGGGGACSAAGFADGGATATAGRQQQSGPPHQGGMRRWASQFQQLLQKEQAAIAELRHVQGDTAYAPRDAWEEEAAAAAAQPRLRRTLFDGVRVARGHVQQLQRQLDEAPAGAAALESLASAIDAAEAALADAKAAQIASYTGLVEEEQRLERQLAELEAGAWALGEEGGGGAVLANGGDLGVVPPSAAGGGLSQLGRYDDQRGPCVNTCGGATTAARAEKGGQRRPQGLLPEVEENEAFVARHGPTGGWHEEDHSIWCKVLRRCKGDAARAVIAAEEVLPAMTRPQLLAHARWHARLADLDTQRREALAAWRRERDMRHAAMQAASGASAAKVAAAAEDERHLRERDQQGKELRQVRRSAIDEWRAKQRAESERLASEAAAAEREAREAERQMRAKRQEEAAALLAARKSAQEEERMRQAEAAAAAAAQKAAQAEAAAADQRLAQERAAERAAAAVVRRGELLAAQSARREARAAAQQRIVQEARSRLPFTAAVRDPSRVLSQTAAAAARTAHADSSGNGADAAGGDRAPQASGFVLHVLRQRATPAWIAPLVRR